MIKHVQIVPYNPEWPRLFEEEAMQIRCALGVHCIDVHHIGSTSVPGLSAKEDLDILCVVDSLPSSLMLQTIGYVFKGELNVPLRSYFSKNTHGSKVNLHVTQKDHGFIALNLCFRDYLRRCDETRHAYEALKLDLVQDPSSFQRVNGRFPRYTLKKDRFIKSVLQKANFQGFTMNFCMHDQEWATYHRIRREQIFDPLGVVYDLQHPTLTSDQHHHVVLYQGVKIVSVAHVEWLSDQEAALRSLATDTEDQKKGYATILLHGLEAWLDHHGRKTLKMHAAPSAELFYRRRGYSDMVFDDPSIQPQPVDLGKMFCFQSNILEELKAREPIFHHPHTFGTSVQDIAAQMCDEFWEVGASGNIYTKQDILDTLLARYNNRSHQDVWEAKDFVLTSIAPDNYLLTYVLIQDKTRVTRRSTIWRKVNGQWKILYHQGTLISGSQ